MWRGRGSGVALIALIALIAVPASALAASPAKPVAGKWSSLPNTPRNNFVVSSSRTEVTSLTISVEYPETNKGCPTGTVTVPGPLELKEFKFEKMSPFWAFGLVVPALKFVPAPFSDSLDGKRLKGATLELTFATVKIEGREVVISGGGLNISARCGTSVGEAQTGT